MNKLAVFFIALVSLCPISCNDSEDKACQTALAYAAGIAIQNSKQIQIDHRFIRTVHDVQSGLLPHLDAYNTGKTGLASLDNLMKEINKAYDLIQKASEKRSHDIEELARTTNLPKKP